MTVNPYIDKPVRFLRIYGFNDCLCHHHTQSDSQEYESGRRKETRL